MEIEGLENIAEYLADKYSLRSVLDQKAANTSRLLFDQIQRRSQCTCERSPPKAD